MVVRRGATTSSESGQALLEFSLVLPVFLLLLFGLVEFGFLFSVSSSVNFVSRVGAMLAAEGGRTAGTDCMVLQAIERDLTSPSSAARVSEVDIYWSDANGDQIGANANAYVRGGSMSCDYGDGSSITVPYTRTSSGYPESARCDVLAGCDATHTSVDTIGVRVTYMHQWVTSFGRYIAGSLTFQRSTAVRMEPTL
jgi:Flp pilus assembly protein TadG